MELAFLACDFVSLFTSCSLQSSLCITCLYQKCCWTSTVQNNPCICTIFTAVSQVHLSCPAAQMTHWFSLTLLYFSRQHSIIVGALFSTMQTCFFVQTHLFITISDCWAFIDACCAGREIVSSGRRRWQRGLGAVASSWQRGVTWRDVIAVRHRAQWTGVEGERRDASWCARSARSRATGSLHLHVYQVNTASFTTSCLVWPKDVNESRNVRVSKKILVLENLVSWRARNSRSHKAKLCCPN